jgi:hypothetical protein
MTDDGESQNRSELETEAEKIYNIEHSEHIHIVQQVCFEALNIHLNCLNTPLPC